MNPNDFEQSRRERETRNERLICWVAGCLLLAASLAHLGLRMIPGFPAQPPRLMIAIEMAGALIMAGLLLQLQLTRDYRWWRKYALSAWNIGLAAGINLTGRVAGDPLLSLFLAIPIYSFVVLLSGLRYSTGAVLLTGALAMVAHIVSTVSASSVPERLLALAIGLLLLSATSLTVFYLVRSLLSLHRDSVSKERLRRFFAPEVVEQIMAAPQLGRGAVEAEVTVLFSDITEFTQLASRLSPQQVIDLLNEYFPVMTAIVFRHHGTLEKYIGDALLAVWGVPLSRPDDASRAVQAAVEMQKAIEDLNRVWSKKAGPSVKIHIGLHTGRVAAGHIGTDQYLQYATIGDTTNVASRICALAGPGEIVLSATTREKLADSGASLEELPRMHVKGKAEPLVLHRLAWEASLASSDSCVPKGKAATGCRRAEPRE
jgi:class 3 adenylate cyclase